MPHAASAITAPDTDHLPVYWQFHEAVTRAQLASWLPSGRRTLVDVSGPRASGAELAAAAGHTVLRVIDRPPGDRPTGAEGAEGVWGKRFPPRSGGFPGVVPPGQPATSSR